jgi:hypothetical protein
MTTGDPAEDRRCGGRLVAASERSERFLVMRAREVALAYAFGGARRFDVASDRG